MDFQLHQRVVSWLKMAGDSLIASLTQDLQVEEKTDPSDLVTRMDKETEAFLIKQIQTYYPDHQILGEEGTGHTINDAKGILWVIDPIDGTLNFVKQGRYFGIMVGIFKDGQPLAGYIYDVMNADLYYGIKGQGAFINDRPIKPRPCSSLDQVLIVTNAKVLVDDVYASRQLMAQSLGVRSYGCSAYEMIAVIRGEAGLYLSAGLMPWDAAAGIAILDAMGYAYGRPDGQKFNILEACPLLVGSPAVYQEAQAIIAQSKN